MTARVSLAPAGRDASQNHHISRVPRKEVGWTRGASGRRGREKWALESGRFSTGRVRAPGALAQGSVGLLRSGRPKGHWQNGSVTLLWGCDGLTFLVAVELVLRAVLGLLDDQLPGLDVDFELQFLSDPQRLRLHL